MAPTSGRVELAGSERHPLSDAHVVGPAHPDEHVEVTLVLRPRPQALAGTPHDVTSQLPRERHYSSRQDFERTQGADPADIGEITAFAQAHGLAVVQVSAARRSVSLAGTVGAMNTAFGVTLEQYATPDGTYRGRTGAITLPAAIASIIQGVFGLDDRPQASPRLRMRPEVLGPSQTAGQTSYTPPQIAQLYDFPKGLDGRGQTIALIELGGGYHPRDLHTYFGQLGLTVPTVAAVSVDHGRNHPTTAAGTSADAEVMLDIEVAGAVAPGARIVVYFAPNTDRGFWMPSRRPFMIATTSRRSSRSAGELPSRPGPSRLYSPSTGRSRMPHRLG